MSTQWRAGKRVGIIGAGPAGVSTALAFLKFGYDVKLFDNTRILEKLLRKDYLADQEKMTLQLKELHVSNG